MDIRIGHGYDVHRLVENRKCIIGGVEIPHKTGLLGHSDADVLVHAIMDSILGALCMGDIGKLFPDTDNKFKDESSLKLMDILVKQLWEKGYVIGNIDSTIIAQKPKMSPYIFKMRENIANILKTDINNISVKATTEEKLGFTGEEKGIAAHAVCIIVKK